MSEKRRGLGRGLGALIPSSGTGQRPVDVFFGDTSTDKAAAATTLERGEEESSGAANGPAKARHEGTRATDTHGAPAAAGTSSEIQASAQSRSAEADSDGTMLVEVPGARFAEIPVGVIHANARQPRTVFDSDDLAELVESIKEVGVLQPIVVRPSREQSGGYELIMGERRWRATQEAGLETVPAIIRETEDSDLLRDALLENLHRAALNPLEEAAAYQQLLDDFDCTQEELARRIARSRPQISNTLRLLKLPPAVQRRVAAGVLSAGHARALLRLESSDAMERLAQRVVAEGLSVRATEEIAALGSTPEEPARRQVPRAGTRIEALDSLAQQLSDRFDTRVKIALGKAKGRLSVEFASVDDLNRILEVLAPGVPGLFNQDRTGGSQTTAD